MEIPPINPPRVQTTHESKRGSAANQALDIDKNNGQMNQNATIRSFN